MSVINVTNVTVLDNPCLFTNPLQFEIQYECLEAELAEDIEWKITYVGSAEDSRHDQVLDSVMVGPIRYGPYRFVFQADAPNPALIPEGDLVGVTVVLLTCSYKDKEFLRVGYYVNVDYTDEELCLDPPEHPLVHLLYRNIIAASPRVTRFQIPWDHEEAAADEGLNQPGDGPSEGGDGQGGGAPTPGGVPPGGGVGQYQQLPDPSVGYADPGDFDGNFGADFDMGQQPVSQAGGGNAWGRTDMDAIGV